MVELEAEVVDINDVKLLNTGNITLADATLVGTTDVTVDDMTLLDTGNVTLVDITDVKLAYTDLIIGDATGIISVDTAAVDAMNEDDAIVNDVVDNSDIVSDVVRLPTYSRRY